METLLPAFWLEGLRVFSDDHHDYLSIWFWVNISQRNATLNNTFQVLQKQIGNSVSLKSVEYRFIVLDSICIIYL